MFCGKRVPVQTMSDYLEADEITDDFLEGFPSVTRAAQEATDWMVGLVA